MQKTCLIWLLFISVACADIGSDVWAEIPDLLANCPDTLVPHALANDACFTQLAECSRLNSNFTNPLPPLSDVLTCDNAALYCPCQNATVNQLVPLHAQLYANCTAALLQCQVQMFTRVVYGQFSCDNNNPAPLRVNVSSMNLTESWGRTLCPFTSLDVSRNNISTLPDTLYYTSNSTFVFDGLPLTSWPALVAYTTTTSAPTVSFNNATHASGIVPISWCSANCVISGYTYNATGVGGICWPEDWALQASTCCGMRATEICGTVTANYARCQHQVTSLNTALNAAFLVDGQLTVSLRQMTLAYNQTYNQTLSLNANISTLLYNISTLQSTISGLNNEVTVLNTRLNNQNTTLWQCYDAYNHTQWLLNECIVANNANATYEFDILMELADTRDMLTFCNTGWFDTNTTLDACNLDVYELTTTLNTTNATLEQCLADLWYNEEWLSANVTLLNTCIEDLDSNITALWNCTDLSNAFNQTIQQDASALLGNETALAVCNAYLSSNSSSLTTCSAYLNANLTLLNTCNAYLAANASSLYNCTVLENYFNQTIQQDVGALVGNETALATCNAYLSANVTLLNQCGANLATNEAWLAGNVTLLNTCNNYLASNVTALWNCTVLSNYFNLTIQQDVAALVGNETSLAVCNSYLNGNYSLLQTCSSNLMSCSADDALQISYLNGNVTLLNICNANLTTTNATLLLNEAWLAGNVSALAACNSAVSYDVAWLAGNGTLLSTCDVSYIGCTSTVSYLTSVTIPNLQTELYNEISYYNTEQGLLSTCTASLATCNTNLYNCNTLVGWDSGWLAGNVSLLNTCKTNLAYETSWNTGNVSLYNVCVSSLSTETNLYNQCIGWLGANGTLLGTCNTNLASCNQLVGYDTTWLSGNYSAWQSCLSTLGTCNTNLAYQQSYTATNYSSWQNCLNSLAYETSWNTGNVSLYNACQINLANCNNLVGYDTAWLSGNYSNWQTCLTNLATQQAYTSSNYSSWQNCLNSLAYETSWNSGNTTLLNNCNTVLGWYQNWLSANVTLLNNCNTVLGWDSGWLSGNITLLNNCNTVLVWYTGWASGNATALAAETTLYNTCATNLNNCNNLVGYDTTWLSGNVTLLNNCNTVLGWYTGWLSANVTLLGTCNTNLASETTLYNTCQTNLATQTAYTGSNYSAWQSEITLYNSCETTLSGVCPNQAPIQPPTLNAVNAKTNLVQYGYGYYIADSGNYAQVYTYNGGTGVGTFTGPTSLPNTVGLSYPCTAGSSVTYPAMSVWISRTPADVIVILYNNAALNVMSLDTGSCVTVVTLTSSATMTTACTTSICVMGTGDWNNDGYMDFYVADTTTAHIYLFQSSGGTTSSSFTLVTNSHTSSYVPSTHAVVALADVSGTSKLDLLFVSTSGVISYFDLDAGAAVSTITVTSLPSSATSAYMQCGLFNADPYYDCAVVVYASGASQLWMIMTNFAKLTGSGVTVYTYTDTFTYTMSFLSLNTTAGRTPALYVATSTGIIKKWTTTLQFPSPTPSPTAQYEFGYSAVNHLNILYGSTPIYDYMTAFVTATTNYVVYFKLC